MPSDPFYTSPEWRRVRRQILKRDNHTCQLCFKQMDSLHVDHILPRKQYPQYSFHPGNLRCLCVNCHMGLQTSFGRKTVKVKPKIGADGFPE